MNLFLILFISFVLGCMASQIMKNMCGGLLVEGNERENSDEVQFVDCKSQKADKEIITITNTLFDDESKLSASVSLSKDPSNPSNSQVTKYTLNGSNLMVESDDPINPILLKNDIYYDYINKTITFEGYDNDNGDGVQFLKLDFKNKTISVIIYKNNNNKITRVTNGEFYISNSNNIIFNANNIKYIIHVYFFCSSDLKILCNWPCND